MVFKVNTDEGDQNFWSPSWVYSTDDRGFQPSGVGGDQFYQKNCRRNFDFFLQKYCENKKRCIFASSSNPKGFLRHQPGQSFICLFLFSRRRLALHPLGNTNLEDKSNCRLVVCSRVLDKERLRLLIVVACWSL